MQTMSSLRRFVVSTGLLALALGMALPATAAAVWNENLDGDLSSDGLAPTALNVILGANTVIGSMGGGDIDYFKFTVPSGALLSAVIVNPGTAIGGSQSFFAIQSGPQVTVTPTGGGTGPGSLLAFDHYDASDIGGNLLARLLPGTAGLAAGTYSIWLNETAGSVPYSFDLVLTAVPEPAGSGLLVFGLGALALARRRTLSLGSPNG